MGEIRSIRAMMELSVARREAYPTRDGQGNITTLGYFRLNRVAGLSLLTPTTLSFSGGVHPNPLVEFSDDKNRTISFVAVRRIALGRSPKGSLQAVDRTVLFSLHSYMIQDLIDKVTRVKECGGYGTEVLRPRQLKEKGTSVSYSLFGDVRIWVDFSHPEIQECLRKHTKRVKFAERIATSMTERNCLRSHASIGIYSVDLVGGIARVPVIGYREEDLNYHDIEVLTKKIEDGEPVDGLEKTSEEITASAEEVKEEADLIEGGDEIKQQVVPSHNEQRFNAGEACDPDEWTVAHARLLSLKYISKDPRPFLKVMAGRSIIDLRTMSTKQLQELGDELEKEVR